MSDFWINGPVTLHTGHGLEMERRAIGIDLSVPYRELAIKRLEQVALPLPMGGGQL